METVGLIVLLIVLAFGALVTVAVVKTAQKVKRGIERSTAQARRAVEDQRLRARRFALPGALGELAQLRLELRTSIDSTFEALDSAELAEAAALMNRLDSHARALDAELRLLEREPDRSRVAAQLPALTERAHRITHSADALRWAAQDRARHAVTDDLADLTREVDMEARALRHWEPAAGPLDGSGAASFGEHAVGGSGAGRLGGQAAGPQPYGNPAAGGTGRAGDSPAAPSAGRPRLRKLPGSGPSGA
ncbi:hypothetical protein [Actinacidiphila guanduensis]|uniref:Secreted protein n=1 Tax=Actinacidiphila guanduensis TaxID=310781 RepID=A0A1H0GV80_9ACTN|nr:hypothetical protein [Actinacidiphila guanduensis]SDO10702.1 hypothetical protein SAMN05216259_107287 [Actinacidiphila guanduensis]